MLLNDRLETDLYVKPTDKHQYLLKSSCHPSHTKQSIPFSMALRLRRICSTEEFFNTRSDALTSHPIKRGYKYRFIRDESDKVRQIPRSRALKTSTKKESNRIPLVVAFNPALPNIRQVIFSNLNILYNPLVTVTFTTMFLFLSTNYVTNFPCIIFKYCNRLFPFLVSFSVAPEEG